MYLPEAETLLKEVNKRHRDSQREMEAALSENTRLKSVYHADLQAHSAQIEKLKALNQDL